MLYRKIDEKLTEVKEVSFKLEKDLQVLVEGNLYSLFGLKFLDTEFKVDVYRFDTIAFNEETNSFTIIEYKRGRNESLVDQGYAYLYTLLNRKADFVLLFNEKNKANKTIKDFDWTQTRIIFISPQFTTYQKSATSFINMPFELYEIKQYDEGIIDVERIIENKSITTNEVYTDLEKVDDKISTVNKEIIVYSESDHLSNTNDAIKELYETFKEKILEFNNVTLDVKKMYIAFKGKTNIVDIIIQKRNILIFINMKKGELSDPEGLTDDISTRGHLGNGDYQISINDDSNLHYILSLIKQSWIKNK